MADKKVYLLITTFPHDGGMIRGVYSSRMRAKQAAKAMDLTLDGDEYYTHYIQDLKLNKLDQEIYI